VIEMKHILPIVVGVLAAASALPSPLMAQARFESPEHGFSIELPWGWRSFPASQLRHLNAQASSSQEQASEFLAIVENEKGGKITIRLYPSVEEEDALAETRKVAFEPRDTTRSDPQIPVETLLTLDLIYGQPHWDEEDAILWTAFRTGRMRAIEARRPYREGVIRMTWIGMSEEDLVEAQALLAEMIDSLRFWDAQDLRRRR